MSNLRKSRYVLVPANVKLKKYFITSDNYIAKYNNGSILKKKPFEFDCNF